MVAIALVYTMVNITEANEIRIPEPKPDTMFTIQIQLSGIL